MGERWTKLLESGTDSYLLVQSLPTFDDMRFKTPLNNVKAADPDFLDPSSGMKDGQPNYLEEREDRARYHAYLVREFSNRHS
jgi:hypothetical protein